MILEPAGGGGRGGQSARFLAVCSLDEAVGDMVYISGSKILDRYVVTKVDIDDPLKRTVFGMIINKTSPTLCVVQHTGRISNIYSGLPAGRQLFITPSSRLSSAAPSRPSAGTRLVQVAAISLDANELLLTNRTSAILQAE